jgi:hypothetical protein
MTRHNSFLGEKLRGYTKYCPCIATTTTYATTTATTTGVGEKPAIPKSFQAFIN